MLLKDWRTATAAAAAGVSAAAAAAVPAAAAAQRRPHNPAGRRNTMALKYELVRESHQKSV